MRVRVKYLLWLALKTGTSEEVIEVPENSTIASVLESISKSKPPGVAKVIESILKGESEIIVLHNSKTPVEGLSTVLRENDVITLMPPVSGGVLIR